MSNDILDDNFSNKQYQAGSDANIIKEINLLKIECNEYIKQIKGGRIALIVLAVIAIAGGYFAITNAHQEVSSTEVITGVGIMAIIYLACAFGVKYHPFRAFLIAFCFYLLIQIIAAILEPSTIGKGWILRITVILFLGRALYAAHSLKKAKEDLEALGIPSKEIEMLEALKTLARTQANKTD